MRRATLAALAALALAACGDEDEAGRPAQKVETQTTRVEVVEGIGDKGGFNAQAIYRRLSPGVVTVIALLDDEERLVRNPRGGLGSGFVLDGDGAIVTNAHVVTTGEGPRLERARAVYVQFGDGNRVRAQIVGADPNSDVALLKIDPRELEGGKLVPLPLGSSEKLAVGDPVAAIGSPFGENQSLSVGVVSALDRSIESLTAYRIGNAIQTDAAINHGNSGGPLLDAAGRVIGVNSQIRSTGGGGEGVGFAIPVETVERALGELREDGRVRYAYLGISSLGLYPQLARRLGVDVPRGAVVEAVEDGSPADKAGIEPGEDRISFQSQTRIPRGGDVIVGMEGRPVNGADDLSELIAAHDPGDKVRLRVVRRGRTRTVTVTLAERPNRAPPREP